jgi:hypothetical protein
VLRSTEPVGPWEIVGKNISDADFPYAPLFTDESAVPGESYYYAVVARNATGESAASNEVGPVQVSERVLVDNCLDLARVAKVQGDVQFVAGEDRKTREDSHRLRLLPGSAVTYKVDGDISRWSVEAYFADDTSQLTAATSLDGVEFQPCEVQTRSRGTAKNDYNYLRNAIVNGECAPGQAKYLRLELPGPENETASAQIGRVVIHYGRIAE